MIDFSVNNPAVVMPEDVLKKAKEISPPFLLILCLSRIQGYLLVKIAHRFLLENSQNLRGS